MVCICALDKQISYSLAKVLGNLVKSVDTVTSLMLDSVNNNVAIVFQNQKLIEGVCIVGYFLLLLLTL
jgi:hypothetical protein